MKADEVFTLINTAHYQTVGDEVDYSIITNDEEKRIYLLFQPSNQKRDWVNNFAFPVKPYKHQARTLWYHGGYCRAWKSCNDLIMSDLLKAKQKHLNYTIVIAGWSYGGAMALLAAEDWNYRTNLNTIVITFGAPKVCWGKQTAETIKRCCNPFEFAHVNDVVPLAPPFPMFRHVFPVRIGSDKRQLSKLIHPEKWHCIYGDPAYYEEVYI